MTNSITGSYAIKPLEKELQNMFNATYNSLIEKMTKDKRTEVVDKLKSVTRTPVKFRIQKSGHNYVLVLNVPFLVKVTNVGNFAKIFKFEQTITDRMTTLLLMLITYRKVFKNL